MPWFYIIRSLPLKLIFVFCNIFLLSTAVVAEEIPEMVLLEGGQFIMGTNIDKERFINYDNDGHQIYLYEEVNAFITSFEMSKTEITVKQFLDFINATGYKTSHQKLVEQSEDYWDRFNGLSNYPMHYICAEDALAYCQWISDLTGDLYRLPTEAEWEYAARKETTFRYPWGNEFKPLKEKNEFDLAKPHLAVDEIDEDITTSGIRGMLSGGELTIDVFRYNEESCDTIINPLVTTGSDVVQKGQLDAYYFPGMATFSRNHALYRPCRSGFFTFRIVRQVSNTVFNDKLPNSCIYETTAGLIRSNIAEIYSGPGNNYSIIAEVEKGEDFQSTFVKQSGDEKWYRIYFEKQEPFIENRTITKGYFGWIIDSDIEIVSTNWYE